MGEICRGMMLVNKDGIEDWALIGGLVGVQFVYAGNSVFLSFLMSIGLHPYTIVVFSTFSTFILLSPVAIYYERSKWPKLLSLKFVIQLIFISFAGVTLFQSLFLKGINLTSPAMATAMPNLAPGLIFLIAWVCRLEKVKLNCMYSRVKIVGTFLCVVGALSMSIMHSTNSSKGSKMTSPIADFSMFNTEKIIGCLYLIAAVFVLASNVVLQAATLGAFPAPISLCAITSLIGVFITVMVQLIDTHSFGFDLPLVNTEEVNPREVIFYCVMAGAVSGASVSFNGWAMKKRGPVLVSMFNPMGTVISVILSVITLGDPIRLGSLAGMVLMFTGLYFVLWAKGKEFSVESDLDETKPLLS